MIDFIIKDITILGLNNKVELLNDVEKLQNLYQKNAEYLKSDILMLGTNKFITNQGRHRISRGIINYAQRIQHLLMTDKGSMPSNPLVGIPWSNYIGKTYASQSVIIPLLVADITKELYTDYGTKNVNSVTIEFLNRKILSVNINITPFTFNKEEVSLSINGETLVNT